jgi:mono/diheme cytochrome c family protein
MTHGAAGGSLHRRSTVLSMSALGHKQTFGERPPLSQEKPENGFSRLRDVEVLSRFAITFLLLATSPGLAEEAAPFEQRGRALAEQMCSACHAVGRRGNSPHVGAPPFRTLDRRLDLDSFTDRLREGLMVGHPDMPAFRFTREDARAFLLYLRSIQVP